MNETNTTNDAGGGTEGALVPEVVTTGVEDVVREHPYEDLTLTEPQVPRLATAPSPVESAVQDLPVPQAGSSTPTSASVMVLAALAELNNEQTELFSRITSHRGPLNDDQVADIVKESASMFSIVEDINLRSQRRTGALYYYLGVLLEQVRRTLMDEELMQQWLAKYIFRKPSDREMVRQMRALASAGPEILPYCGRSKNTGLEMIYVVKEIIAQQTPDERLTLRAQLKEMVRQYPFPTGPEMNPDDTKEFRVHVDAIVTKVWFDMAFRDKTICTFDDAKLYADRTGLAVVRDVARKLAVDLANDTDKRAAFLTWLSTSGKGKKRGTRIVDASEVGEYLSKIKRWKTTTGQIDQALVAKVRADAAAKTTLKETYELIGEFYELVFLADQMPETTEA